MSTELLLAEGSIEIRRPSEDVFAYVSNLENFPAWFPGVLSIRSLNTLAHGAVGKRYRETLHMRLGRTTSVDIEVKDARPATHLTTQGSGFLLPSMKVNFTALTHGETRVAWSMVSRNQRWWFRWFVLPALRRVMGARAGVGLRQLREILERESA